MTRFLLLRLKIKLIKLTSRFTAGENKTKKQILDMIIQWMRPLFLPLDYRLIHENQGNIDWISSL